MEISYNKANSRVGLIDEIRGFAIICMVIYHLGYDLTSILRLDIPFFFSSELNFLRNLFAGIFICVSGIACRYSRNNLKRGIICFGLGLIITLITWIFMPSQIIIFGILHMLGICMVFYAISYKIIDKLPVVMGIILSMILFILTWGVTQGYIGILNFMHINLLREIYNLGFLFAFGFTPPHFSSSDYFPLFPWLFLFIAGCYIGRYFKDRSMPQWFYKIHFRSLAFAGRNTLIIYLAHQPIIMLIILVVSWAVQS